MQTEEKEDKGAKTGCTDFESACKGFQEMFKGMSKCCMMQDGSIDCSAIMDRMMKIMVETCCGPKADNAKSEHGHEKI